MVPSSAIQRQAKPLLAAFLVLGVFVLAPALGLVSRMAGDGTVRLVLSATQWHAVQETLYLMAGVALLAGGIGVACAWLVSVYDFPLRRLIEIGLVLPLAFPTYLAAFVAVDLLDFFGPLQTLWRGITGAKTARDYAFFDVKSLPGAILVLGLVLFPYVYIPCRIIFSRSGRNMIDAARLLGASGWPLFRRIGLPVSRPALIAGLVLAMLETLNDIGASEHLGVSSLSVVIRDLWLNRGDLAGASRLAGLLVALVAILLLLEPGRTRHAAAARTGGLSARPRHVRLAGGSGLLATFATGLPVLLGFVIPAAFLVTQLAIHDSDRIIDSAFFGALFTSLAIGVAVSGLVVTLGAGLAIVMRIAPLSRSGAAIATLGYAVPGTVLVLAMLPVLRLLDDALAGLGVGLLVSGSSAAIIYALGVRFLGIGSGQAGLALSRLPVNVDHVARLHGTGDMRLALRVHLPAMAPGLKLAAVLVFIDTMKELPATLLLRPLNVETLATRAYAQASAGMFERAAPESLAILLISGVSAYALARRT